jgi:microcystin-dependent protein
MAYQVKYTDITKTAITVQDSGLNNSTSMSFVGKNYAGYGPVIAENFLHLLENHASSTAPTNPVQGQLWYSTGESLLKVNVDGTSAGWQSTGSVKKATTLSPPTSNAVGDLWVDTTSKQLYVYSGSSWLLIGPQYSSGNITGPKNEDVFDTNGTLRSILSFYVGNTIIAIVSKSSFTPKAAIIGFTTINRGINISSNNIDDTTGATTLTKLWGTAEKASALVVNDKVIDASNFLRSDVPSTTNYPFSIRSTSGISIGSDLSFSITSDDNSASPATVLYSKTGDKSIQFRLTGTVPNNSPFTLLQLDATNGGRVGIGAGNVSPQATLDIKGTVKSSGSLTITDATDATTLGSTASITTNGGLNVNKKAFVGGALSTYAGILVNNLVTNNPTAGAVIQPGSDSATGLYDIGSATRKFRTVYTTNVGSPTVPANVFGTLTGTLVGNVSGTASGLSTATNFKVAGDIKSVEDAGTPFDGISNGGVALLNTVVATSIITNRPEATESLPTDQLLIYRTAGTSGSLNKTSKQTFMSSVPTMPVGAILPFAGPKSSLPNGYLLCDGGELLISQYTELYNLIKYTYRPASQLKGYSTFALPDLRGRFPLGIDSMDNNRQVPDGTLPLNLNPTTGLPTATIDAGGNRNGARISTEPANRVTDTTADVLGGSAGFESTTLISSNLPEHKHSLKDGTDQFFIAAVGPVSATNTNTTPLAGFGSAGGGGVGLNNSGGVIGSSGSPSSLATINPYLAINYIIFTGKLV